MGLLDDAIREHLDLKRRRGADPAEVERAEREALGPVRRAPGAVDDEGEMAPDAGFDEPGLDHATGYEDEADNGFAPETGYDDEHPLPPALEAESTLAPEPAMYEPEPVVTPEPHDFSREPDPYEPPAAEPPEATLEPEPVQRAAPPEPEPEADSWSYEEDAARTRSPAPHPAGDSLGGETAEYDVEAALDEEPHRRPQGGDEDVLEETPEFLQDTPDHDRLWFEQRPPKDFDFDG